MEQFLRKLLKVVTQGRLPSGKQIDMKMQDSVKSRISRALAIYKNKDSTEFDKEQALAAVLIAVANAGFFGSPGARSRVL